MALSTTRKGNLTIAQYVGKMKAHADDMASVGKKLDDEVMVGYILAGLDSVFDLVMSSRLLLRVSNPSPSSSYTTSWRTMNRDMSSVEKTIPWLMPRQGGVMALLLMVAPIVAVWARSRPQLQQQW
jgi:hypothetical protein